MLMILQNPTEFCVHRKNILRHLLVLSLSLLSLLIASTITSSAFAFNYQGLDDTYWYMNPDDYSYQGSGTDISGTNDQRYGVFGMFYEMTSGTGALTSGIYAWGIMDEMAENHTENGLWQVYQATSSSQTVSIDLAWQISDFDDGNSFKSEYSGEVHGELAIWIYDTGTGTWSAYDVNNTYSVSGGYIGGTSENDRNSSGSDGIQASVNISEGTIFAIDLILDTTFTVGYMWDEENETPYVPENMDESISGDFTSTLAVTSVSGAASLNSVPVPATAWLLGLGLSVLLGLLRSRHRNS